MLSIRNKNPEADTSTLEAKIDRLAHNAHQITLKGESIRKKLRLKNNQFSQLESNEKTS